MVYTQEELTNKVYEKVFAVYDIFKNHFGEDKVDLQGMVSMSRFMNSQETVELDGSELAHIIGSLVPTLSILVWWPHVTVTNENNKSIHIQDLYAKIPLTVQGTIPVELPGFKLTRATYPKDQFLCNYLHSHAPRIPSEPLGFVEPCLGRGPIRNTINSLKMQFDDTFWMLFCQELSLYVTVESLTGVPYYKLEEVGMHSRGCQNDYQIIEYAPAISRLERCIGKDWMHDFLKFYLEHGHLVISYNNCYTVGMPFQKFMIDISNSFIEYYNQCLANHTATASWNTLLECDSVTRRFYVQGRFRKARNRTELTDSFTGKLICHFKGKEIHGRILQASEGETEMPLLLLDEATALVCLEKILQIINFNYSNEHDSTYNTEGAEGTEAPISCEKVLYV